MTHATETDADPALVPTRRSVLASGAVLLASGGIAGSAAGQTTITGVIPTPEQFADANLAGFIVRIDGDGADDGGADDQDDGDEDTRDDGGDDDQDDGGDDDQDDDGGVSTDTVELAGRNTPNGTVDGDGAVDGGGTPDGAVGTGDESDGAGDDGADDGGSDGGSPRDCDFQDWPPDETTSYDAVLVNRKEGDSTSVDTTLHVGADADLAEGDEYLVNTYEECDGDFVGVSLEDVAAGGGDAVENVEDFEETDRTGGDDGGGAAGPGFGVAGALAGVAALGGWLARRRGE